MKVIKSEIINLSEMICRLENPRGRGNVLDSKDRHDVLRSRSSLHERHKISGESFRSTSLGKGSIIHSLPRRNFTPTSSGST